MQEYMLAYIDHVNEVNRLMKRAEFSPAQGSDIISLIRRRSERVHSLLEANNAIVREHIDPLLAPDALPSDAVCAELNEFADRLCTYTNYIDIGLAFNLHQKLLSVAEGRQDTDQIIAQKYALGIASYLLYYEYEMFERLNVREHVTPWFHQVAAYLPRFAELSHASRGYVLRSLNNEALIFNSRQYDRVDAYMQILRRALAVFNDPAIRALEPTIPWDAFVCAVYRNCLRLSDTIEQGYGLQYIPDVQRAAAYLTEEDTPEPSAELIDRYSAIELENTLGHIDSETCVARMNALCAERDKTRFDREGIDQNVNVPSFTLIYEARLSPVNVKRMNRKIRAVIAYVNAFRKQTGQFSHNYAVANFIRFYPDTPCILPFRDVLQRLMLAMHVPTYVHSRMVSSLAVLIARALLAADPAYFVGSCGIVSAEDAMARSKELLSFIRFAGLFHDTGKFYCMDVISQYSRRLVNAEFDIIRLHAECGFEILSDHPSTAAYAEVALVHHITYDRRGGYAREFLPPHEEAAAVSDIVRIADAIDASTDNIGRCYAVCKTQESIMAELLATPMGYSPRIIAAMNTPAVQRKLRHVLGDVRSRIYEKAYVFHPDSAPPAR